MQTAQHRPTSSAAIYVSTRSGSMASTRNQIAATRSYAEETGFEVVREYVDLRGERTQLFQMIADATAPDRQFRKVVVYRLRRISRRVDELSEQLGRLVAHGVEIVSATEPEVDTLSQPIGDLLRSAHSERVRRGMRTLAQRGFYVFAMSPYGYRKVAVRYHGAGRFTLELGLPASETVRWIFDLRLEGASELEIAAELNARRASAPTAGRWTSQQVRRILSNEVYCGTSVAAKQDMASPDTVVRVPSAFPAIVSQEEFDLVQGMKYCADVPRHPTWPPFAASSREVSCTRSVAR